MGFGLGTLRVRCSEGVEVQYLESRLWKIFLDAFISHEKAVSPAASSG